MEPPPEDSVLKRRMQAASLREFESLLVTSEPVVGTVPVVAVIIEHIVDQKRAVEVIGGGPDGGSDRAITPVPACGNGGEEETER